MNDSQPVTLGSITTFVIQRGENDDKNSKRRNTVELYGIRVRIPLVHKCKIFKMMILEEV